MALTSPPYRSAQLPPPTGAAGRLVPRPVRLAARCATSTAAAGRTTRRRSPRRRRSRHRTACCRSGSPSAPSSCWRSRCSPAASCSTHLVRFDWPIVVYAAISVVVGYGPSVWWCLYAAGRWGSGDRRDDLGLRFRWSDLGWGPVVWLAAVVLRGRGGDRRSRCSTSRSSSNTEGIGELDLDRTYVIALLVTAVVAAPIVEEMVFRGLMLRGLLSRMSAWLAVGVQGLLFGAAHVDPARGAGNIGLALVLGARRRRVRRRRLPAAPHRPDDPRPRHLQRRRDGRSSSRRRQLTAPTAARRGGRARRRRRATCSTRPGRGSSPRRGRRPSASATAPRRPDPSRPRAVAMPGGDDPHVGAGDRRLEGVDGGRRHLPAVGRGRRSGWWTKASTGRSVATASRSQSSCSAVPSR